MRSGGPPGPPKMMSGPPPGAPGLPHLGFHHRTTAGLESSTNRPLLLFVAGYCFWCFIVCCFSCCYPLRGSNPTLVAEPGSAGLPALRLSTGGSSLVSARVPLHCAGFVRHSIPDDNDTHTTSQLKSQSRPTNSLSTPLSFNLF